MTSAVPKQRNLGQRPPDASRGRRSPGVTVLCPILALLGGWSVGVPYLGRALGLRLNVSHTVEVVDHVVPGLGIVAFSALMLMLSRRGRTGGLLSLSAACMIFLGGLWITATHVPLVADAARGRDAWATALFHTASGPVILALAVWLVVLELREPDQASGTGERGRA